MEKYGVVTDDGLKKHGSEGRNHCPKCGSALVSSNPDICPKCGSQPMEHGDGEEEKDKD